MKQSGIIPVYPNPEDYKLGQETVLNNIENRTSDWLKYAPSVEKQYNLTFDTGACASFSLNNVIEFQLNYLIAENKLSKKAKNWLLSSGYIESDGKVNLSDRYLALVSNTTDKGNDLRTVVEAFRKLGAVPENKCPFLGKNKEEYLSGELSEDLKSLGKEFLEYFNVSWDWTFYDQATGFNENYQVEKVIQQAPIQIGITTPAKHATILYDYLKESKIFKIYDTYEPFFFENTADIYNPHFGMRAIIQENVTQEIVKVVKDYQFKMTLTKGMKGKEVEMLQVFLISQGLLKQGLNTGFFGDITLQAVKNFQMKYGITTTGNVGQLTNAKINELNSTKKKL